MGALVNGVWTDESFPTSKDGRFKRPATAFRDTIAPGGRFAPERNRYHLYVSYACPWAHRTLVFRKLKQLEEVIPVTVVDAFMGDQGWAFGEQADPLYGKKNLHELYTEADRKFTGRVTVPVLWDKKEATIVNNESSEIIRIFNSAFNDLTGNTQDFYPERLREKIDAINSMVYDNVNNGVYKVGFAKTQKVYEEAAFKLFDALEELEKRLSKQRYLVGNTLTEADWRLFTTLVRFDPVYVYHFKSTCGTSGVMKTYLATCVTSIKRGV